MKTLIVFYSRTNVTKKIAEALATQLDADLEQIKSVKSYAGPIGYLMAGREATLRKSTDIEPTAKNPADYDLVVVGTPIWSFNMSSPVRAYLEQQKDNLKKVAFFCTMGGSGDLRAFADMTKAGGQESVARLTLLTKEVTENKFSDKLKEFTDKLS